jgi:hypothetical protein
MIAAAELAEQVQADFAVVGGVVVMAINDEYIIDLDARENLKIGDILTLVKPGKKIFHPQTKEVLGTIDEAVGFLRVTRILSGYSYAKVLTDGLTPENGAAFKRFEQVPALLVDETAGDAELARRIKASLPQFNWLEKDAGAGALLTFTLQDGALEVRDARGDSLHKYLVTEDQQLVGTATTATQRPSSVAAPSGPEPKLLQKFANTLTGVLEPNNDERFAEMDQSILRQRQSHGIWLGPQLDGHPAGLTVGDLDGDGQQETALVLDNTLEIARISAGEYTPLAQVNIPSGLQVLSVDALDLDGNGRAEIYLSSIGNYRPASLVVEYTGADYQIVIRSVRWLLRVVDLADDLGSTLIGQRMGNENEVYVGDVFHVRREGDQLVQGDAIKLPVRLNIYNFVPFRGLNKELNYAYLTEGDYLKVINSEGVVFWESAGYFGGSETCFTIRPEIYSEMLIPSCMRPRLVRTPGNEILAVQNDGQRMVQRYRKFQRSRAVSLSWNGLSLVENWQTASQSGYLGDFALADANNDGKPELVMAVKFKHGGLIDKARSAVVIYELQ